MVSCTTTIHFSYYHLYYLHEILQHLEKSNITRACQTFRQDLSRRGRGSRGEIKTALILIACLPGDAATFNVLKLTQVSGTSEPQSGNADIFILLPRKDKRLCCSYFRHYRETFKHASHKNKRWPLILTPSRFSCDKASTEAGKI